MSIRENVSINFGQPPDHPIKTFLIGEKVIVWNPDEGTRLYRFGYFGNPTGLRKPKISKFTRALEHDVFESAYLLENNFISIEDEDGFLITQAYCEKYFDWMRNNAKFKFFDDLYLVYKDLRLKRYIPKPGLKFGSDFTVYKKGPGIDHAPFLIRIFPRGSKIIPLDVVSVGRLANSVKKRYIMGVVIQAGDIRYYEFKWVKP